MTAILHICLLAKAEWFRDTMCQCPTLRKDLSGRSPLVFTQASKHWMLTSPVLQQPACMYFKAVTCLAMNPELSISLRPTTQN